MNNEVTSIPELFEKTAQTFPANIAIWEHVNDSYAGVTYLQLNAAAIDFANGLFTLGIQAADRIALLSEGKKNWIIAELGLFMCGAACVPLSVKLEEPEDILFRILHSGAKMILISTNQYPKIDQLKQRLPNDFQIVVIDEIDSFPDVICFNDVMNAGQVFFQNNPNIISDIIAQIKPDDLATISYTSGTTADPKGIMLTHNNYIANINQCSSLFHVPEYYVNLLLLPWDHSFAHTVGIYTVLSKGAAIACVQQGKTAMETLRNIPKNIKRYS